MLLDVDLSLAPFGETLAEDVIEAVVNILNLNPRSNCKNQLIIRPKFNVLGSILGSGCNFARIVELDPVLEEIFIFTHQSFLAIIRKLTEKYGVNVAMLPVNLQKMHHQILAMQTTISDDLAYSGRKLITQYAQHVGTELAKGTCKLSYILPQRGHAIQMVLVYDYIKKDYSFDCLIYGGNEYARWDICAEYIKKMSADCDITVVCSAEDKQCSASWSLGVDPSVNMHHLVSMLLKCCEIADVDNQNANIDIICMFIRQISVPERMEYLQLITRPLSIAEINSLFAALENITTLSIEELQARNVSRNNLDTIVKKIIEPLYNSSLRPHPLAENQRVILAKISERIIKLIENFMLAQRTKRFPGQEFGWLEDPFK